MKIGLIADTHNHRENTSRALEVFRQNSVERLIHCGDITSTPIVEMFEGFKVTFVFGNMDQFHADLMEAAKKLFGIGSMGYHYTASIDGKRVAVVHGNDEEMLQDFIREGAYNYVFHGHTHRRRDTLIGKTRVINPGALGGRRPESRSVCILDLEAEQTEFVIIDEPEKPAE